MASCNYDRSNMTRIHSITSKLGFNPEPEQYYHDSLYMAYTAKQFIENSYGFSGEWYRDLKVYVDTILYSPDNLKVFSLFISNNKNTDDENVYNGNALVGYRDSVNKAWKMYNVERLQISNFLDYKETKDAIRQVQFFELKGMSDEYDNKFQCNPIEECFWTDLYFQKGKDIDSLYYFQVRNNFLEGRTNIVPYFNINYPDSLIKFYMEVPKKRQ